MSAPLFYFNTAADGWGVLFCVLAIIILITAAQVEKKIRGYLLGVFVCLLTDLLSNMLGLLLRGETSGVEMTVLHVSNYMEFFCGYVLAALLSCYLLYILQRDGAPLHPVWRTAVWGTTAVSIALLTVSQFNGMFYSYVDGVYQRGQLFWLSQLISVALLLMDAGLGIYYRARLSRREQLSLAVYVLLPAAALLVQLSVYGVYVLLLSCTLAAVYMLISVLMDQQARYYLAQRELADMRAEVVLSQVRPHFLYNSLSAIAQLCEKDPAEAKQATLAFADYLRMNMSALNTRDLVPFSRELDHIKTYLFLEQLRFGAELQVVMDIGTTDFMLPALTVQPLVENAVKWGIGKREDGGTVRLTTRMTPLGVEIVVSDDGVGFDTKKAPAEDGRSHLGIQLVRQRLKDACGAELELSSRVGEGTVARIVLPKGA